MNKEEKENIYMLNKRIKIFSKKIKKVKTNCELSEILLPFTTEMLYAISIISLAWGREK